MCSQGCRSSRRASARRVRSPTICRVCSACWPVRSSRRRAAVSSPAVPKGSPIASRARPRHTGRCGMAEHRPVPEVDRAAAARRAVERRRARASLKRDLTTRVISPQTVLQEAEASADSVAGSMRVTDFLMALPAIGEGKRDRILAELHISPVKRLGGLGIRQRRALQEWLDGRFPQHRPRGDRSRLLVLAGPTAVGKGTVAAHIRARHPEIHLSVSATTRAPRPGEVDGVHYYFVDDETFDRMIADGDLLEYATVHNRHRYGTPRRPIDQALAE